MTHLRFVPCRKKKPYDPCTFDVEIVAAYQQSKVNSHIAKRLIKFHHRGDNAVL